MTKITEYLAICFCVVIACAFGFLERGGTSDGELRINEGAGTVASRYANPASKLDRQIRLKDVRITLPNWPTAAKLNEIVTSARPSAVVTPLPVISTAFEAKKVSAIVLESSPNASAAIRHTKTNFANTERILLGNKTMNDSIDPYHNDVVFKKMPTQLKYAIKRANNYRYALLRKYRPTSNRKETNIDDIVALYNVANNDRNMMKQPVQEAGSRAAELIVNYKALRKVEESVHEKANHNFATVSKTPSSFLARYETLKPDEHNSISTLLNAAVGQKDERTTSEEVGSARTHGTEIEDVRQTDRASELKRPKQQRRKKRQTSSAETLKTQEVFALDSQDVETETAKARGLKIKKRSAEDEKTKAQEDKLQKMENVEKSKDEEAEMQMLRQQEKVDDEKAANLTDQHPRDGNVTDRKSSGMNVLLMGSIAFAVIVQLIIFSMILVKNRKGGAESVGKTKKPEGEKQPLNPSKKVSATKPPPPTPNK